MKTQQRKKNVFTGTITVIIAVLLIIFLDKMTQIAYAAQPTDYIYEYAGIVFESKESAEDAWKQAITHQYDHDLMTLDEIQTAFDEFIREQYGDVKISSSNGSSDGEGISILSSNTLITGQVNWQISAGGGTLPLREAEVIAYQYSYLLGDFMPIGSTYTNINGEFSISIQGKQNNIIVRVHAGSRTFRVTQDWIFDFYSLSSGIFDIQNGSTVNLSFPTIAYDNGNTSRAFYISQGMIVGQRFATAMGANISSRLNVNYPLNVSSDSAFAWNVFSGIGTNTWSRWDTLIHEYAHFLHREIDCLDISLFDYIFKGATHTLTEDHLNRSNKSHGMQLAWSESWATAFSLIAQNYYASEYMGVNGAGDASYNGSSMESVTVGGNSGEGQELTIIATLWDIFDTANDTIDGVADNFSASHLTWWNMTTRAGTYTLTDFANSISTFYPQHRNIIGSLMGRHKIAPHNLTVANIPNVSTAPSFSWRVNGSQSNPNNQFRIAFYNMSGVQQYETGNLTVAYTADPTNPTRNDLRMATVMLTQAQWETVLDAFPSGGTAQIAVKGYLSNSPVSGPYWSATKAISVDYARLKFTAVSGGYSVTGVSFIPSNGVVDIPAIYNGQAVISIGSSAFANQTQLSQITIPASIRDINSEAFQNCTNLQTVAFSGTSQLQAIGSSAFLGCTQLSQITIPASVISIGRNAFRSNTQVDWQGNYSFRGSEFLGILGGQTTFTVPSEIAGRNITTIVANALSSQNQLSQITIPASVIAFGNTAFHINTRVDWENNYSFRGSEFLGILGEQIAFTVPSEVAGRSITSIGANALSDQNQLNLITIPASVINFGNTAFHINTRVDWQGNYSFKNSEFLGILGGQTIFSIPSDIAGISIIAINVNAFANQNQLSQITIPASIINIESKTFNSCSNLTIINVSSNNMNYSSLDGVLYNKNQTTIIKYPQGKSNNSFTISENITEIGDYAFYNCLGLTSIIIPNNVISIGFSAFSRCQNLNSITLPFIGNTLNKDENSHFGYIFGAVFNYEHNSYVPKTLVEVIITGGTKIVGSSFLGCDNIINIYLPASIKSIGGYAFESFSKLGSIVFAENSQLKEIGEYAFFRCYSLNEIFIPKNVIEIKDDAFNSCHQLGKVEFEEGSKLVSIGESAFIDCYNLKSILIPQTVSMIKYGAFHGTSIFNNTPENNVVYADNWAVGYKGNLENYLILENNTIGVADSAFAYNQITHVKIPASVKYIGDGSFHSCSNLESVLFEGMTELGHNAFDNNIIFNVIHCSLLNYYKKYSGMYYSEIACKCSFQLKIEAYEKNNILTAVQGKIQKGFILVGDELELVLISGGGFKKAVVMAVFSNEISVEYANKNDYVVILLRGISNEIVLSRQYIIGIRHELPINTLNIQDYNYSQQYYFYELTNEINLSDLLIATKRLRTGLIQGEYIVMSPRRAEAGVAYLEYSMSKSVSRIDIDLALWSVSELLRTSDCTAVFQYKDENGIWTTKIDLLNDISLTTDRTNPIIYSIIFDEPVTEFRFYLTSPAIGASANTGRFCIGNMNIYYI